MIILGNVIFVIGMDGVRVPLALYLMVYLFTSGKVTDVFLTGFNRGKATIVITDHAERIAEVILDCKARGVKSLKAEGPSPEKTKK